MRRRDMLRFLILETDLSMIEDFLRFDSRMSFLAEFNSIFDIVNIFTSFKSSAKFQDDFVYNSLLNKLISEEKYSCHLR